MKGISPLIASVLLIAFTVSIATIILGWFSGFVKTTTENVSSSTEQTMGCSVAGISIEHIYLNVSGSNASVVVKNTGYKDFSNVSALIVSKSGATCSGSINSLKKGMVGTLSFNCASITSCDVFDRAIVTTECGGVSDTVTSSSYCSVAS